MSKNEIEEDNVEEEEETPGDVFSSSLRGIKEIVSVVWNIGHQTK